MRMPRNLTQAGAILVDSSVEDLHLSLEGDYSNYGIQCHLLIGFTQC